MKTNPELEQRLVLLKEIKEMLDAVELSDEVVAKAEAHLATLDAIEKSEVNITDNDINEAANYLSVLEGIEAKLEFHPSDADIEEARAHLATLQAMENA